MRKRRVWRKNFSGSYVGKPVSIIDCVLCAYVSACVRWSRNKLFALLPRNLEKEKPTSKNCFYILVGFKCLIPFPSAVVLPAQKSHFYTTSAMLRVNPRWFKFNIDFLLAQKFILNFFSSYPQHNFFLISCDKLYYCLRI